MPTGQLRVNFASPITQGLSFAYPLSYSPFGGALFTARGQSPLATANGGWASPTASGMALTSDSSSANGAAYSHNGNTYTFPTAAGTMVAFLRANWSPTDSTDHYIIDISSNGTIPAFDCFHHTDNILYCGWFGAGESRATVSASGLWTAGDAFVVALTWTAAGGTTLYTKGVSRNNNATAPTTFDTTGKDFAIGGTWNGSSVGGAWSTANGADGIHFIAIWDRALTPAEILSISNNPTQIFATQNDDLIATLVGFVPGINAPHPMLLMGVGK